MVRALQWIKVIEQHKLGRWFVRRFFKSLVIVDEPHPGENVWALGLNPPGDEEKPCLQMSCRFSVLNRSGSNVHLSHALIKGHESREIEQRLYVKKHNLGEKEEWGDYPIPPGEKTDASLTCVSTRVPTLKKGEPLIIDVTIVDHLGQVYHLKNMALHASPEEKHRNQHSDGDQGFFL